MLSLKNLVIHTWPDVGVLLMYDQHRDDEGEAEVGDVDEEAQGRVAPLLQRKKSLN